MEELSSVLADFRSCSLCKILFVLSVLGLDTVHTAGKLHVVFSFYLYFVFVIFLCPVMSAFLSWFFFGHLSYHLDN